MNVLSLSVEGFFWEPSHACRYCGQRYWRLNLFPWGLHNVRRRYNVKDSSILLKIELKPKDFYLHMKHYSSYFRSGLWGKWWVRCCWNSSPSLTVFFILFEPRWAFLGPLGGSTLCPDLSSPPFLCYSLSALTTLNFLQASLWTYWGLLHMCLPKGTAP